MSLFLKLQILVLDAIEDENLRFISEISISARRILVFVLDRTWLAKFFDIVSLLENLALP